MCIRDRCIRWCSTGAYYTAKLTFSHDFPIKVWGCVLYQCAYYIRIFTVYRCGHRGNYLRPQCQYDTINGCGAIYQLQLTPSHWLCGWISRNVDEISWSRTVNGSWITEFPTLWLHELLKWIHDFLCNRKQCVIVNGLLSDWFAVLSGIPQGGPTNYRNPRNPHD